MKHRTFWTPSADWSFNCQTSSILTSVCLIYCWVKKFCLTDSMPMFAVESRCTTESTPCWNLWPQKTSATSFWKHYVKVVRHTSSTTSLKTEVRNAIFMPHLHGIVPVHVEANLRPLNIGLHTAWRRAQDRTTWKKLMRTATPCPGACYWRWWFMGWERMQWWPLSLCPSLCLFVPCLTLIDNRRA